MSVRRLFFRSRWDNERRRELEGYLAIEIDENLAHGMTPEEAGFAARHKLGSLLETLWQDVRYGSCG